MQAGCWAVSQRSAGLPPLFYGLSHAHSIYAKGGFGNLKNILGFFGISGVSVWTRMGHPYIFRSWKLPLPNAKETKRCRPIGTSTNAGAATWAA